MGKGGYVKRVCSCKLCSCIKSFIRNYISLTYDDVIHEFSMMYLTLSLLCIFCIMCILSGDPFRCGYLPVEVCADSPPQFVGDDGVYDLGDVEEEA